MHLLIINLIKKIILFVLTKITFEIFVKSMNKIKLEMKIFNFLYNTNNTTCNKFQIILNNDIKLYNLRNIYFILKYNCSLPF